MSDRKNKSPASGGAGRTSNADEISFASFHIITNDLLESNGDDLVTEAQCWATLVRLFDSDMHVGRTNSPSLLADLVGDGRLQERNAKWLREFADLIAEEPKLKIDPLIEAARRILLARFSAGGWCG